ncbi:MAG: hypothetical protein ABJG15_10230 [Hyphomonadaceae bacterium]
MMFVGGIILLAGIFSAILWFGLSKAEPTSDLKTRVLTLLVFVGLSGVVYGLSGEPDYTAPRLTAAEQNLGAALRPDGLGPVETYGGLVSANSQEKTKWLDVAESLRLARRPVEAADALLRAAGLAETEPEQAALFGAAGETLVMAKGGIVDDEAAAAFASALKADSNSLGALYYLGRQARSGGDEETARNYWSRFLEVVPSEHPLAAEVRGDLALIGGAQRAAPRIAPVLTPEMVAQFEGLTAEERQNRITSMLGRVESRLTTLGDEASSGEWRELARAYVRVEDLTGANAAYERAVALAPNDVALALERSQIRP